MWRHNEKIPGGACMTSAVSVKERLKRQAVEEGKTMQDKLITYGLESDISDFCFGPCGQVYVQRRYFSLCAV